MALTKEDKKDVQGAMGKALANKVEKATRDRANVSVGAKLSDIGYTIEDHKGNVLKKSEGKGRFSLSSKSQALAKKSGDFINKHGINMTREKKDAYKKERVKKGEYGARGKDFNTPSRHANFMKVHKLDY